MIFYKTIDLLREKGVLFLLHKLAVKFCKRWIDRDVMIEVVPYKEFFYIDVTPTNNPEIQTLRTKDNCDYALQVPFDFPMSVTPRRIVAIIHIYYPELCSDIIKYLCHIPHSCDLCISTDTQQKKEEIHEHFKAYNNGRVTVEVFENRGRDIAPMMVGFREVFEQYDYFIHLHSKKSPHGEEGLVDWREYLFENLLGSTQIVLSHLYLLEHHNVGIVFPQHFIPLRININWGYDFTLVKNLLKKVGITIDATQLLEFPSGSMFWGRTDAIRPLLDANLSFSDFPQEAGQIDGTLAHAIERSFLYCCEASHYRWAKVVQPELYLLHKTVLEVPNASSIEILLPRVYRPLFNRYTTVNERLAQSIVEYTRYNTYPSLCTKPRLNLMVPTINAKETFGGIATALKVYHAFQEHLKESFDYRIIVDIALINEETKAAFHNYTFMTRVLDDSICMQLVQTLDTKELQLRERDFFIATAWWTATTAFYLLDDQHRFFNVKHKLIYLIQDYESNFNAWSPQWVYAENSYKEGERTVAIINSEELALFMSRKYTFDMAYFLPYTINTQIKEKLIDDAARKKQILFYGRPTVARNAFSIIVEALALWQQRNPITCKLWQIYSLGEMYEEDYVQYIENITVVGKASLEEYAALLSESMIGISLMISPHPSYPPLEMAYAGVQTITNNYEGKDLTRRSANITALDVVSVEQVANAIEHLVDSIEAEGFHTTMHHIDALPIDMEPFDAGRVSQMLWS